MADIWQTLVILKQITFNLTLFDFFFERTNSWGIRENEQLGISFQEEYEFNDLLNRYHPIYFLLDRNSDSILLFLEEQKGLFIKTEGVYDREEFQKFISHSFIIDELNQFLEAIHKSKCGIYYQEGEIKFTWFELQLDTITKTLILTNKSITQIKVYFKSILDTIDSFFDEKPIVQDSETSNHNGFQSTFFSQNSDKLRKFKLELVNSKLIANDTSLATLSKSFTGENLNDKIKWIGKQNQLKYLINQLTTNGIINEDKSKWMTASNCFVKKDGGSITSVNLKGADDPISNNQHLIDELIRKLRR